MITNDITSKYIPPHLNIFYCLRAITLTYYLVQVAITFAMTFYYRPTVIEAFAFVQYIMVETNFSWLIRSVHQWSTCMMVLMMIVHEFREVKIVTCVPEAIIVIGSSVVELLRKSASVGQSTLTRFYSLHTFVLPLLTVIFMLMHFSMIWKQCIFGPF
ncbi:putative plastoquinol--plastocyanin reductase [Lupinus albus]|uniref:Putative plastoquinol--plastocyanin reductase n=1 Tax=Lupinus albus TaxID=3870 RepID=A0A6A4P5Y5_LUPAL|nr:putative plastoquinol--plastocyanin reductase [Lupinus albus]